MSLGSRYTRFNVPTSQLRQKFILKSIIAIPRDTDNSHLSKNRENIGEPCCTIFFDNLSQTYNSNIQSPIFFWNQCSHEIVLSESFPKLIRKFVFLNHSFKNISTLFLRKQEGL